MDRTAQLDDLGIFVRVVEQKSMSGAARRLGVPKSTVSRAVARLEDGLKVRLLQRTTRALAPTDAGAALYAEVLPHVEALRGATSVVTELEGEPRGVLRVTAPNDIGALLLPDIVTRFHQRYPEVRVELILTQRTVDLIGESVDLAIRAGQLRDSTLVAKKLRDTEFQLYAAPAYLALKGTPRTVAELSPHDIVMFRGQNGRARWTLETKTEKSTIEVTAQVSGDDFSFVVAAAVRGAGVALMPRFVAAPELRAGRLVRVLPNHSQKAGAIYAVHASAKHVPRKVGLFRDFLFESFQGMPPL
jgi:DNA-binding transcriptional LysR family regulator